MSKFGTMLIIDKPVMETPAVVKKPRGRAVGQVKQCTTIEDPVLGDYYIEVTKTSFDVCKKGGVQPIGFFSSLESALKFLAKEFIPEMGKRLTIKEYIAENNKILDKMKTFLS